MRKRAQFNFMFTDSAAKHFYGAEASMGFYYCTHNTRLFFVFFLSLRFSCFFFFFLLCLFVVVCSTSEITFILFFACRTQFNRTVVQCMSLSYKVPTYTIVSFVNAVFAFCFALYAVWTRCAFNPLLEHNPQKSHANQLRDASATACVWISWPQHSKSFTLARACFVCICVFALALFLIVCADLMRTIFIQLASCKCATPEKKTIVISSFLSLSKLRHFAASEYSESPQSQCMKLLYYLLCVRNEKPIELLNDFQLFNWLINIQFLIGF